MVWPSGKLHTGKGKREHGKRKSNLGCIHVPTRHRDAKNVRVYSSEVVKFSATLALKHRLATTRFLPKHQVDYTCSRIWPCPSNRPNKGIEGATGLLTGLCAEGRKYYNNRTPCGVGYLAHERLYFYACKTNPICRWETLKRQDNPENTTKGRVSNK